MSEDDADAWSSYRCHCFGAVSMATTEFMCSLNFLNVESQELSEHNLVRKESIAVSRIFLSILTTCSSLFTVLIITRDRGPFSIMPF